MTSLTRVLARFQTQKLKILYFPNAALLLREPLTRHRAALGLLCSHSLHQTNAVSSSVPEKKGSLGTNGVLCLHQVIHYTSVAVRSIG